MHFLTISSPDIKLLSTDSGPTSLSFVSGWRKSKRLQMLRSSCPTSQLTFQNGLPFGLWTSVFSFGVVILYSLIDYDSLRCDEEDIWTGKAKDPSISRVNYGTAQKMWAAVSHKFGRDLGLGTQPWAEHILKPGKFTGNPSLSVVVSQYMISLRRRKVICNYFLYLFNTNEYSRCVQEKLSQAHEQWMSQP